ncbi:amidohydrolase [Mangrovimonas aestuarii]|uniref:amidohydrolase n=1 Tax=Mangrovimonas aestuarii TaxID=3018443 RepID=UPI0023796384|nr:amidohydrolase [Mangrovimonas aestuarii]
MQNTTNRSKIQQLIDFRRETHKIPELSGFEKHTASKVVSFLKQYNPSLIIEKVGGHGVLAIFDSGNNGKSILLRAELDALPIEETNTFDHRSKIRGISHKCGHDGHITILLGLAQKLQETPPPYGKVFLLFQPAEETGNGAKAVLDDSKFKNLHFDFVFALHNLPGYPLNQIVVKENTFTAAVCSLIITLKGKTSHAAEPEHGINPAWATSEILKEIQPLNNNKPKSDAFSVITPVYINLGEKAYGVAPGNGEIHLTIRCWTEERLMNLIHKIKAITKEVSDRLNIKYQLEKAQHFRTNKNHREAVKIIGKAAEKNKLTLSIQDTPFKWGEDFGLFTQNFKGAMFGLGAGEDCPALHNPDYDFPDTLIPTGINMFYEIMLNILK